MRRLWFGLWYWMPRRPPWDTGITPPEVERFVASHAPGRAVDLGCGTGTNAVYLARHGWSAMGVDFAGRAIAKARRRARDAGVSCTFFVGDVAALEVPGPFDLALDIGCLHSISVSNRAAYATGLARAVRSGGTYLLYPFAPRGPAAGPAPPGAPPPLPGPFHAGGRPGGKGTPAAPVP